jgi:hypothetical protein
MDYIGAEWYGGGGFAATKTHVVICALFSSPIYDDAAIGGPSTWWFTNDNLIAIDQDPAVICATRWIQTNGCDVYLKPLGTPTGPQYALGIVNRSSITPTNVTLYLTNLPPLFDMRFSPNWSAFDCATNVGWAWQNTNAFSVTIDTNNCVLWRLFPSGQYGFIISTNYISGQFYTNNYPNNISILANVSLNKAAVSGNATMALWIVGISTNATGDNTTALTVADSSDFRQLAGYIPGGCSFVFTNTSTGSGNSSALFRAEVKGN